MNKRIVLSAIIGILLAFLFIPVVRLPSPLHYALIGCVAVAPLLMNRYLPKR